MKCIDNNEHIQKPKKIACYWQQYKFCIKWQRYSTILAPILPFTNYLCNAYIVVNDH